MPAPTPVMPAPLFVIPAKAGIQGDRQVTRWGGSGRGTSADVFIERSAIEGGAPASGSLQAAVCAERARLDSRGGGNDEVVAVRGEPVEPRPPAPYTPAFTVLSMAPSASSMSSAVMP